MAEKKVKMGIRIYQGKGLEGTEFELLEPKTVYELPAALADDLVERGFADEVVVKPKPQAKPRAVAKPKS